MTRDEVLEQLRGLRQALEEQRDELASRGRRMGRTAADLQEDTDHLRRELDRMGKQYERLAAGLREVQDSIAGSVDGREGILERVRNIQTTVDDLEHRVSSLPLDVRSEWQAALENLEAQLEQLAAATGEKDRSGWRRFGVWVLEVLQKPVSWILLTLAAAALAKLGFAVSAMFGG